MMIEDVQGCAMNMRYHSERADFTVKVRTYLPSHLLTRSITYLLTLQGFVTSQD